MFVVIYYKPNLFNAHTMILFVHIFMNVNKLCLNQLILPKFLRMVAYIKVQQARLFYDAAQLKLWFY